MLPDGTAREAGWSRTARIAARMPRLLAQLGQDPGELPIFLFARLPPARAAAARLARLGHPVPVLPTASLVRAPPTAEVLARLRSDGVATALRLADALVAELRSHAEAVECVADPGRRIAFRPDEHAAAERRHGRALLTGHVPDVQMRCPGLAALVRDPWLHAVAAHHLGAAPRGVGCRVWWSFPSPGATRRQLGLASQDSFHFDLSDWGQVKVFFYLVDVDASNGAHLYVRGSHAWRPSAWWATPFQAKTEAQIRRAYGAGAIGRLDGSAGSGFIEDVFGYHTGMRVQAGRRLMLEIGFSLTRPAT